MNIKKKSLYKTEMCESGSSMEHARMEKRPLAHGRRELRRHSLRKKKINILSVIISRASAPMESAAGTFMRRR